MSNVYLVVFVQAWGLHCSHSDHLSLVWTPPPPHIQQHVQKEVRCFYKHTHVTLSRCCGDIMDNNSSVSGVSLMNAFCSDQSGSFCFVPDPLRKSHIQYLLKCCIFLLFLICMFLSGGTLWMFLLSDNGYNDPHCGVVCLTQHEILWSLSFPTA